MRWWHRAAEEMVAHRADLVAVAMRCADVGLGRAAPAIVRTPPVVGPPPCGRPPSRAAA
jgi:hypothetical protein